MAKPLVIVESPAKARKIAGFLGSKYVVESSIGHVRDLPSSAAEVPEKYQKESWKQLGVNVDEDFEPIYIVPPSKRAQVKKLQTLLKSASELYLATDEDREGEAIAWHLSEILKPKVPVKRMVFHEITASAIRDALAHPRDLDQGLVQAQEARRILDRLYGYEVSPVLWRKVRPKLSAGRVQSVATRLIVDRERERMSFVAASYWDVDAELTKPPAGGPTVLARLIELSGKRLASGKDFDADTGKLKEPGAIVCLDEARARSVADILSKATFEVAAITERPHTQRPAAPFITSTLQQEAGRKLRFSAQRTMSVAQRLYENGYITYMRTDSTSLSTQALEAARAQVVQLFGAEYLEPQPRQYTKKVRGAQEAHEAIRPAGEAFATPDSLRRELDRDEISLYELVWKRTVASQMKDAEQLRTSARIVAPAGEHGEAVLTASGQVTTFAGFLRAYHEDSDDPDADDEDRALPPLAEGDKLEPRSVEPKGHETQPPARFTEASLVKELEVRGIGRPSTYASIIQTIQDRGYVWKKGSALVPTLTAFAVVNLLEKHFADLVDFDFTARMEDDLDAVANGEQQARPWLRRFYFGDPNAHGKNVTDMGLKRRVGSGWEEIDAREISSIPIGRDDKGREVMARVGRYGPYVQIGDGDERASLPDDLPPDELNLATALSYLARAAEGDKVLGNDPASGLPVLLRDGAFGAYVQLGEMVKLAKGAKRPKNAPKPKTASLWPNQPKDSLTLEDALSLLSYPREIGKHPESGEPILAAFGRFGPYLMCGKESRSLEGYEQLARITVDEALKVLAQPKRGRMSARPSIMKAIGTHPTSGAAVELRNGRFGPYVTDGVVNASVPKGRTAEALTLDDALALLEAREAMLHDMGKDPRAEGAAAAKPVRRRASRPRTPPSPGTTRTVRAKSSRPKHAPAG